MRMAAENWNDRARIPNVLIALVRETISIAPGDTNFTFNSKHPLISWPTHAHPATQISRKPSLKLLSGPLPSINQSGLTSPRVGYSVGVGPRLLWTKGKPCILAKRTGGKSKSSNKRTSKYVNTGEDNSAARDKNGNMTVMANA